MHIMYYYENAVDINYNGLQLTLFLILTILQMKV